MGLNALNRNDKYNVSAVYFKREHIRTDGTASCGTHIKVKIFYMYGGMYNIFNGTEVENIAVDFINEATGQIINSANSRDMGE